MTCEGCIHLRLSFDSAGGGIYRCAKMPGLIIGGFGPWAEPDLDTPKPVNNCYETTPKTPNAIDIAAKLKDAGFNDFRIDYERGIAYIYFDGLFNRETIRQTEDRRREFLKQYYWAGFEMRRKEK